MSRHEAIVRSPTRPAAPQCRQENASTKRLSFDLFAILALATLARLAFFFESLGSDEIVYLTRAQQILNGEYPQAVYIGAMRDGITIGSPCAISALLAR